MLQTLNCATIPFNSTARRDRSWAAALVWLAPAQDLSRLAVELNGMVAQFKV
jgi:hypothetical protein